MSIATKKGDGGETELADGVRVSKADVRVEAYGSVDELNSTLGFARSICQNDDIRSWKESIQKTLFRLGSSLATAPGTTKNAPTIMVEDVEHLTTLVHTIEATEGILSDWSLPGSHTEAATFEMARTVCRRRAEHRPTGRERRSTQPAGTRIFEPFVRRLMALRASAGTSGWRRFQTT